MATRYAQLLSLIAETRPQKIIEVGVHRAYRAVMMAEEALKHSQNVEYVGYDVFENETESFHAEAMNGKGVAPESIARAALRSLTQRHGADRFSFRLIIGDTRRTLAGTRQHADFVFIDGDHRLATIRTDYDAVRTARCVVFDDFLIAGPHGESPDTSVYGANLLIQELRDDPACEIRELPAQDLCRHGGYAALVAVFRQNGAQ